MIPHPEKRKHSRFNTGVPMQYRYLTKVSNALSRDIGRGGVCFTATDFIPVNTLLFVALLPKDEPLRASGKIVWVQKVPYGERYNIGLQFTEINDYNKERIVNLESRLLRANF